MSQLNVRINHKYDTYANWMASSLVLNKGEIAVAEIPTSADFTQDPGGRLTPPAIGIKIGDGSKTFKQLNWIQATAGDVYAWAKKEHLEYSDLTEDFREELKKLVNGEVQDTNTTYQFSLEGDVLTVSHKEKADAEFTKLVDITLPFSTKMDKDTDAVAGNLAQFDANGNAVDAGEKIGDFLKKADAESTYAKQADHEKLAEDVSGIDERLGTAEGEIDDLQGEIETLKGTGEGSVKKAVDDAINKFATEVTDNGAVDKFAELVNWVAEHGPEAGEMTAAIQKNAEDIAKNAEDISKNAEDIGKNAEAIAKLNGADTEEGSVAKAVKDAKDALEEQIGAVDEKADKNAEDIAGVKETADGNAEDIAKLQEDLTKLDGEALKTISGVEGTKTGNNFEVTGVPVTLLKNVEGDTLVFNCGTATTVI